MLKTLRTELPQPVVPRRDRTRRWSGPDRAGRDDPSHRQAGSGHLRAGVRRQDATGQLARVPRDDPGAHGDAPPGESSPRESDARLTLSNGDNSLSDELTAGRHTVAGRVEQNPAGLGNYAVQLVRLTGDTSLEKIAEWLHPLELGQYRAPAPGHWLGGLQPMTAGSTGYLTVELTPGRYAWISPIYADQGMVREFTVERGGGD